MARVRGISLFNHLEFVAKTFGPEAGEAVLARMPARSAEVVRKAVAFEWYPLEIVRDLDLAIVEAHFRGDATEAWRMGAHSLLKHVTTIHRVLMHTLHTSYVFKKASVLSARVVEGSTCVVRETGPRQAEVAMGGYVSPHPVICHLARGCLLGVLHSCGHHDARLVHVACSPRSQAGCLYTASW